MKKLLLITALYILASFSINTAYAQIVDNTFNYQGVLMDAGSPANGDYDIQIEAHESLTGNNPLGTVSTHLNVSVSNGLFNIDDVNIGPAIDGLDAFLQISVKQAGAPSYAPLSPRQKLKSTPYATRLTLPATSGQILQHNGNRWQPGNLPAQTPSPWVASGSDISYQAGNVGIGGDASALYSAKITGKTWAHGDMNQLSTQNGLVKYMVKTSCGMSGSAITHSYDGTNVLNVNPAITVVNGASAGRCYIDFPLNVIDRFWIASPNTDSNRSVNCKIRPGNADKLDCRTYTPNTGAGITGDIIVVVY